MDNKKLKEQMLKEFKKMKNDEFLDTMIKVNTYDNLKYFTRKKVNMESFFKLIIAEALKRKIRIPSGGYLDLIEIVDDIKSKKK